MKKRTIQYMLLDWTI